MGYVQQYIRFSGRVTIVPFVARSSSSSGVCCPCCRTEGFIGAKGGVGGESNANRLPGSMTTTLLVVLSEVAEVVGDMSCTVSGLRFVDCSICVGEGVGEGELVSLSPLLGFASSSSTLLFLLVCVSVSFALRYIKYQRE